MTDGGHQSDLIVIDTRFGWKLSSVSRPGQIGFVTGMGWADSEGSTRRISTGRSTSQFR